MVAYADTSFIFSLYSNDANSVQARAESLIFQPAIALTALQQYELSNTLCLAVFREKMSISEKQRTQASIATDIQNGVFIECPIDWAKAYAYAETLSEIYTPKLGCRALDILHIALAKMLKVEYFYSFDVRQRNLAKKVGLKVKPK